MADIFDSWFGESGYQPGGMFDSSWQFSMPQAGDLMQWSPNQTNPALTDLFGLGQIGAAGAGANWTPPAMPNTNLVPNARSNPGLAAVYANQPGGGSGGGQPESFWKGASMNALDLMTKNPALLGAGGAGLAGAIKGSDRAKLPGQVQDLATRATAPAQPDPYAAAELDRTMRRAIGPGWETSTPGIQAKEYAAHLRQQGDRAAAAQGLGTVGQLYALQDANKQKEQQSIFQLASTLGMLGLGGLGAFAGFGYAR